MQWELEESGIARIKGRILRMNADVSQNPQRDQREECKARGLL